MKLQRDDQSPLRRELRGRDEGGTSLPNHAVSIPGVGLDRYARTQGELPDRSTRQFHRERRPASASHRSRQSERAVQRHTERGATREFRVRHVVRTATERIERALDEPVRRQDTDTLRGTLNRPVISHSPVISFVISPNQPQDALTRRSRRGARLVLTAYAGSLDEGRQEVCRVTRGAPCRG